MACHWDGRCGRICTASPRTTNLGQQADPWLPHGANARWGRHSAGDAAGIPDLRGQGGPRGLCSLILLVGEIFVGRVILVAL